MEINNFFIVNEIASVFNQAVNLLGTKISWRDVQECIQTGQRGAFIVGFC